MLTRTGRTIHGNDLSGEQPVEPINQGQVPLADEQHSGTCYFQHLGQFFSLGPEVQGDVDRVQQGGGEIQFNVLMGVHLHGCDPVARSYAQFCQAIGQAMDPFLQLNVGIFLSLKQQRSAVGHDGAGYKEKLCSIHPVTK